MKKKHVFYFTDENSLRDNHAEYWKFETSGGLFQINAKNVRSRQFVEDVLANTRGWRMCRGNNDPPNEGEFVMNCLLLTFVALIWKRPPLVSNFQYSAWLSLIWVFICKIKKVSFFTFFTSLILWVLKSKKGFFFLQFLQCLSPPRMFSHSWNEH